MSAARGKPIRSKKASAAPEGGRERLIDAVVQLGSTTRSLASLGLREVARAAGLNPNTFYRHFNDFDDLGLAVIERISRELRPRLRELRIAPRPTGGIDAFPTIVHESIGLAFAFILEHRAVYVVGIRELHGGSSVLRRALRALIEDLAAEMAEDVMRLVDVPGLDFDTVLDISRAVIRQMSFLGLEYLEQPDRRDALRRQAERFVLLLVWGALVVKAPKTLAKARLALPS